MCKWYLPGLRPFAVGGLKDPINFEYALDFADFAHPKPSDGKWH